VGTVAERIVDALERPVSDRRPEMDRLAREADVAGLVSALTVAKRPLTRQLLCDLLGRIGDPAALDALLGALNASEIGVRASAADAIGKLFGYQPGPPIERRDETLAALLSRLDDEDSNSVISTIIQTLALLGDPAVRRVLESARGSEDPMVRRQAEWGLEYLERLQV
jgi:HEAT repeat protein